MSLLIPCYLAIFPGDASTQTKSLSPNFAVLSQRAAEARDADRLEEAIVLYKKALALRPKWVEGWWALGTLEYDQNHYAKAAQAFERLMALQPVNGTAHAMLGLCQFELGKDELALKNLLAAEKLGVVKDVQLRKVVLYHEGVLLSRKGRFNSAGEIFTELSKSGVQSDELTLGLGMAALRMRPKDLPGEGAPERKVVRRAGRAEALAAAKKFEEAKQEYTSLVNDYPEFPNIQYARGHFLLELADIDEAVAAFQREIKNSPQNIPARLQIAAARYRLDSANGIKYAQEAIKLDPQEPFGHYLLGLLYLDTGNFSGAISELEIAKRSYAKIPDVYFALGNAYARAGRKQEAVRARATFTRLNAESKKENTDLSDDEQPSGLTREQSGLRTAPKVPD